MGVPRIDFAELMSQDMPSNLCQSARQFNASRPAADHDEIQ